MVDRIIDRVLSGIFSVPSFLIHVVVVTAQFVFHIDENAITNYISWEAIFLSLMIGIQQLRHHEASGGRHEEILQALDTTSEPATIKE